MQIEMTGKEDRLSPWKVAIGGFPGSGKTLFASTAPEPLFVFFRENPRIKSIADRHVPHVKVVNDEDATVLEKMQALAVHLELTDDFKTLVIDTGDELQQAMKEARRIQNGGEFSVGDWSWLGDAYRELLTTFIDLSMRVIVLFHVKTAQEGEDGHMFRELMLQGTAKDEAPGWFDVVGALDTYETVNDEGEYETHRVLLTHSSRMYPWVKDHSGNLPRRWELSDNFVGDVPELEKVLNSTAIATEREVLGEIADPGVSDGDHGAPEAKKITPEELEKLKNPDTPEINKALDTVNEIIGIAEEGEPSHEEEEETNVESPPTQEEPEPQMEEVQLPVGEETEEASTEEEEVSDEEEDPPVTTSMVVGEDEEGKTIDQKYVCEECGEEAPEDVAKMSRIRYKKVLCRDHYLKELRGE